MRLFGFESCQRVSVKRRLGVGAGAGVGVNFLKKTFTDSEKKKIKKIYINKIAGNLILSQVQKYKKRNLWSSSEILTAWRIDF